MHLTKISMPYVHCCPPPMSNADNGREMHSIHIHSFYLELCKGALKVIYVISFTCQQHMLEHPMLPHNNFNSTCYAVLLYDKVWSILQQRQQDLLDCGTIIFQDNAAPHHNCEMQWTGDGSHWYNLLIPHSYPHMIIFCLLR